MFRGIDPGGLTGLANTIETRAGEVRRRARLALELLDRSDGSTTAATIGAAIGRVDQWAQDTATTLRWRADTIRSGQQTDHDVFAQTRAEFATQGVFSLDNVDDAYRGWIKEVMASTARVTDAVASISDWLDQGWTDWDVTNNDLHNISATLAGLSADELNRVLAALSVAQLQRWVKEMGNGMNGFSRAETQGVFAMLAANSTGESLGRVHDAIVVAGTDTAAIDFGMAIRVASADRAIVDFVAYAAARDLADHPYSTIAPSLAIEGIEGMTARDEAIAALLRHDGIFELVVADGLVSAHVDESGDRCTEINSLGSLISVLSRSNDPQLKAAAFTALAALTTGGALQDLLDRRHHHATGSSKSEMADRDFLRAAELELLADATRLLVSDTNGVVQQLATSLDQDGAALTSYLHLIVDRDRIHDLGRFLDSLRGGDHVDDIRFAEEGDDAGYPYPHAQNLAFVAATLATALERYADDAKGDITRINTLAGVATLVVGSVIGEVGLLLNALTAGADFGVDSVVGGNVQDAIDDHLASLIRAVEVALQPSTETVTTPPGTGAAYKRWLKRFRAIHVPG